VDKSTFVVNQEIVDEILRYSSFLVKRGYVCNQLGNIAIREQRESSLDGDFIYTKHKGLSLEEIYPQNIVVKDLMTDNLVFGDTEPSIGYQMNREIFRCSPCTNAIIHLHVNVLIAYFSTMRCPRAFRFISAGAPIVINKPIVILDPEVNVESDVSCISGLVDSTNILVMPNHGVTVFDSSLSSAYHKINTLVAEVARIIEATKIASLVGSSVNYLSDDVVKELALLSSTIL
jgi:L-fuculose-phosphate aldolase